MLHKKPEEKFKKKKKYDLKNARRGGEDWHGK